MAETNAISAADVAAAAAAAANVAVQAAQSSADANINQDINTPEGLKSGAMNETRDWNYNLKRNADEHASLDLRVQNGYHDLEMERARMNARFANALGTELVYALAEQRGYRARNDTLITDRMVNLDEVAQLAAKTPVQLDAAASAVLIELISKAKAA